MARWISSEQMAERRRRVAQLKAQGLSHSKIAARLGIGTSTSERDYKIYREEVEDEPRTA